MTSRLKLRLKDPANVKRMTRQFDPEHLEDKIEYFEYFRGKDNKSELRVLKNSNGTITSATIIPPADNGKTIFYSEKKIKSWKSAFAALKRRYVHEVSLTKEVQSYLLKDIKLKFCKIDGLGEFLEIDTQNPDHKLLEFIKNFGLGEKDIETRPYNELILKTRKYARARISV